MTLILWCAITSAQAPPPLTPLSPPLDPAGNPSSADKIMLGKVLFWDEQLSSTNTVACASCHILSSGGTDPRSTANNLLAVHPGADAIFQTADDVIASPGVPDGCHQGDYNNHAQYGYLPQVTDRKSVSVINSGYASALFWDGRADDQLRDPVTNEVILATGAALENQVLGPLINTVEMAHSGRSWNDVINDIEQASPLALSPLPTSEISTWVDDRSYFQLFERVFGDSKITPVRVAMAMASYERSLFSNQTPFDAFIGGNNNALTAQERNGFNLFRTAGCASCHSGSMMTDNDFHNTGVTANAADPGRFNVTGLNVDRGRFKTPSLRHLESKTTFMHNGGIASIEQVIEFYDRGGDVNNPNLDNRMVPLNLNNQQKADLAAFLRRPLNDPRVTNATGPFTGPLLFAESDRVPLISGSGVAGTAGKTPNVVAIEPGLAGNKKFTVAVENTQPMAAAYFVIDTLDPGISGLPDTADSLVFENTTTQINDINDGVASVSVTLPNDTNLVGTDLFARWYVEDVNANNGYATSELIQFELFKPDFGTAGQIFSAKFETKQDCN